LPTGCIGYGDFVSTASAADFSLLTLQEIKTHNKVNDHIKNAEFLFIELAKIKSKDHYFGFN
jgi:hypothetical protein